MEPLSKLDVILSLLVDLKELVDFFKAKDKWFERCYVYLNSIYVIINRYKEVHDINKPISNVFILMKGDLEVFKDFLEKEKNTSSALFFFKGYAVVREAQEHLDRIDYQIYSLNFDVQLENQAIGEENLKMLMESKGLSTSNHIISQFSNKKAGELWAKNFKEEEAIPFDIFKIFLKKFVLETFKLELSEEKLDVVLNFMDTNNNHLIQFYEWDHFYQNANKMDLEELWNYEILNDTFNEINFEPMVLRICQLNKLDEKTYPIGHEFIFNKEQVNYKDYNGIEFNHKINWLKNSIVFGKEKNIASQSQDIIKPDICFHPKSSINFAQFHISYKTLLNSRGFYIKNLSNGTPTCLKVEKTPLVVESGMLFILSNCYVLIEDVTFSTATVDEKSDEYYFINLGEMEDEDPKGTKATFVNVMPPKTRRKKDLQEKKMENLKKKEKKDDLQPFIKIKILINEDQEVKSFVAKKKSEDISIKLGSDEKTCDFIIKELAKIQMKFNYVHELKLWLAVTDEECVGNNNSLQDNYVVLMHGNDFLQSDDLGSMAGTVSFLLRKGMKIAFKENVLEVVKEATQIEKKQSGESGESGEI